MGALRLDHPTPDICHLLLLGTILATPDRRRGRMWVPSRVFSLINISTAFINAQTSFLAAHFVLYYHTNFMLTLKPPNKP